LALKIHSTNITKYLFKSDVFPAVVPRAVNKTQSFREQDTIFALKKLELK
jgi:hypothetical protein